MLSNLPNGQTSIRGGIPGCIEFTTRSQPHLSRPGDEYACFLHAGYRRVLRPRQHIRFAVWAFRRSALLEPYDGEASVWVEVTLLLGKDLVECLVDQSQCRS